MIAFHCTKRAGGASVALPDFVYGPNQRDHSRPGSSVFPERTKNSSRGSADAFEDLAAPAGGGLHHSMRPQCEKSCRSEEHTSELQSPCNLVCRLLLEKKKKQNIKHLFAENTQIQPDTANRGTAPTSVCTHYAASPPACIL